MNMKLAELVCYDEYTEWSRWCMVIKNICIISNLYSMYIHGGPAELPWNFLDKSL